MRQADELEKHCIFRCGTSYFSLLATSIREITLSPQLVRIPGCDESLAGLCHVRSEFVPVLHLNAMLGERNANVTDHKKMLVLNGTGGSWALSVSEVTALQSLETLVNPEMRLNEIRLAAVMGTATYQNEVIRVLDPKKLYRLAQELLQDSWATWMNPSDPPQTATRRFR